MRSLYIDWCPRATNAIDPRTFRYTDPHLLTAFRDYASSYRLPPGITNLVQHVDLVYRTDGIFIFAVTWGDPIRSERYEQDLTTLLAHFVKTLLGHVHVYNSERISTIKRTRLPPIQKRPVKLLPTNIDPERVQLETLIGTDNALVSLQCTATVSKKFILIGPPQSALLKLREMYSRIFDKTFSWVIELKNTRRFGIQIYRSLALYIIIFLLIVLSAAIHQQNAIEIKGDEVYVLSAGALNTFSLLFILTRTFRRWAAWSLRFTKPLIDRTRAAFSPIARMRFRCAIDRIIPDAKRSLRDLRVLLLLTGPFYFSINGVPSFLGVLKLFRLDMMFPNQLENILHNLGRVSMIKAFTSPGFHVVLAEDLMFAMPFFAVIMFSLDISLKRRKIIRVLTHLVGHMHFATIYNAVVEGAQYRAEIRHVYGFNFDSAARIAQDVLAFEK